MKINQQSWWWKENTMVVMVAACYMERHQRTVKTAAVINEQDEYTSGHLVALLYK
jgi:hypothetical protein